MARPTPSLVKHGHVVSSNNQPEPHQYFLHPNCNGKQCTQPSSLENPPKTKRPGSQGPANFPKTKITRPDKIVKPLPSDETGPPDPVSSEPLNVRSDPLPFSRQASPQQNKENPSKIHKAEPSSAFSWWIHSNLPPSPNPLGEDLAFDGGMFAVHGQTDGADVGDASVSRFLGIVFSDDLF